MLKKIRKLFTAAPTVAPVRSLPANVTYEWLNRTLLPAAEPFDPAMPGG